MINDIYALLLIFLMSAIPWVEIFFAIPIGIGFGLNPLLVGIAAFFGNLFPLFFIIFGYQKFKKWREERAKRDSGKGLTELSGPKQSNKRFEKGRRILEKYGIPGLALSGPLITGMHLAIVISLPFKTDNLRLMTWMTASLVVWTVVFTFVTFQGISWIMSR